MFYGLPKIHKANIPLRPITSSIGSPTYNLSKHLVSILSPLLNNMYTVKNSVDFTQKMMGVEICEDEVMVSFDVVSLFTSIPVDLALSVTKEYLSTDTNLCSRTNLSVNNIMRLLEFVLEHCFFQCNEICYQQIFGCAMGSTVSALLANLVMERIEKLAISTANNPPKWWFRYVDDSHCCLKKNSIQAFHRHLNSINKHIQFTFEVETESGLAFLDTNTRRTVEGKITVDIYRKPTHTDRYLDYQSYHPTGHKRSVAMTLFHRAVNVPFNDEAKKNTN